MRVPVEVEQLVEKFDDGKVLFTDPHYNEAQLRQEFVNPFFSALGWEIGDYNQVRHEAGLRSGSTTKHPDYTFFAGHRRAFYVETKKPAVDILNTHEPAHQIRSYGWSGNTEIGILTNFKEFAVYDCRIEPTGDDPPGIARELYMTYEEYLNNWENSLGLFTRKSVLERKHRQVLEDKPAGILRVDEAFLRQLESWRDILAKHIFKQAKFLDITLDTRRLNELVTRTINRIVFLRIAEDRNLEPPGRLDMATRARSNIYSKIKSQFRAADRRYNSGLFHFDPSAADRGEADELAMDIHINDDVITHIIQDLYPPKSLYQFSVISADILGRVYERFLGKVIEVTSSNKVSVEEKPEVRKAGGVYYTPDYIVNYIVENTVGKLLEGKTPEDAAELRILDPACGSGSFLVGAFQYLLDWHLGYYRNHPERYMNRILHTVDGIVLKTREKKRILTNNIYGVDLDPSAVEVSKLSFYLKMLEHENEASRHEADLDYIREQILPDLGKHNIKCGNSLIDSDFFDHFDMDAFENEELQRINPFNWYSHEHGFGEIMESGGFDAVIGNPPYVRQELLGSSFKDYAKLKYETYAGTADLYTYFIERGVKLLNSSGLFGFIVANKWLRAKYGRQLRSWMKKQSIVEITDFGDLPVFEGATTYPCILLIAKTASEDTFLAAPVDGLDFLNLSDHIADRRYIVQKSLLNNNGWSLAPEKVQLFVNRMLTEMSKLLDYAQGEIYRGVTTGLNRAFIIDDDVKARLIAEHASSAKLIRPFVAGKDIKRYSTLNPKKYLIFSRRGIDVEQYPAILNYLSQFRTQLEPKPERWEQIQWEGRKTGNYKWYEIQDTTDYWPAFEKTKIVLPDISLHSNFTYDSDSIFCGNTAYIIPVDDKYLLGILNSRLITFVYQYISATYRGGYLRFIDQYLAQLPIRTINFDNSADVALHDQMIELVDRMLDHQKKLQHDDLIFRRPVELQIERTDREIDNLVYKLYNLTPAEIAIVESRDA